LDAFLGIRIKFRNWPIFVLYGYQWGTSNTNSSNSAFSLFNMWSFFERFYLDLFRVNQLISSQNHFMSLGIIPSIPSLSQITLQI
tara:strand:- start:7764 stop:8018 length:255 start_codon:yes stop_codon:yes gene_type:complete